MDALNVFKHLIATLMVLAIVCMFLEIIWRSKFDTVLDVLRGVFFRWMAKFVGVCLALLLVLNGLDVTVSMQQIGHGCLIAGFLLILFFGLGYIEERRAS